MTVSGEQRTILKLIHIAMIIDKFYYNYSLLSQNDTHNQTYSNDLRGYVSYHITQKIIK